MLKLKGRIYIFLRRIGLAAARTGNAYCRNNHHKYKQKSRYYSFFHLL